MNMAVEPTAGRRPRSPNCRRPRSTLPLECLSRQGLITHLAFSHLGDRGATVIFLNTYHAVLGARPLDVAGESAGGYLAVRNEVLHLAVVTSEKRS